jgi:hypothetical protein
MIINIFENEYVICDLDDSLPVLRHRWKREPTGNDFKSNLLKILNEFENLRPSYGQLAWLADTALLGELDEDTELWLVDEWEDLIFGKSGVKIHAVILGSNIFADYPMEKFKKAAEQKFEIFDVQLGIFSNREDAYRWIREQQALLQESN